MDVEFGLENVKRAALCVSEMLENAFGNDLGRFFELRERSIGPMKIYLRGGAWKVTSMDNDVKALGFQFLSVCASGS